VVAVGSNTEFQNRGAILTSTDGGSWTTQVTPNFTSLSRVCWNGAKFIAVGNKGLIIYSPDGKSWTDTTVDATNLQYVASWMHGYYLWATGNNRIFRNVKFTQTWHKLPDSPLLISSMAGNDMDISLVTVGPTGMIYIAVDDDTSVLIEIKENSQLD
jgi:photosystem II stability/assembly factor-like uncharacterized protein